MNYETSHNRFERLLHERDAADILGCSSAWLQKSRYLGTGPRYIKVGGPNGRAIRYRASDLHEYITTNLVETADSVSGDTDNLKGWPK